MMKFEEKQQALANYKLADLIGHSVARIHNKANKYPSLFEAYPKLFMEQQDEEKIQEQKDELSAIRFKQFADSFNKNYKEVKQ